MLAEGLWRRGVSQIPNESHVRLHGAEAQSFQVFVTFRREILLFQAVLQMILGLLQRAGRDSKEPRELLWVVTTEPFRSVSLGGSDRVADLIAVFEISRSGWV